MTLPETNPAEALRRVVHPTDLTAGGEAAFVHALRIALAARGQLCLVHAEPTATDEEADRATFPGVRRTLGRWGLLSPDAPPGVVAERLGLRVTKADVPGDATRALTRSLSETACDLLVLATHAREGLAHVLHGSVAEALARQVAAPSLLLPLDRPGFVDAATGAPRLRNVLVPAPTRPPRRSRRSGSPSLADALDRDDAVAHALHVGPAVEAPLSLVDGRYGARLRRLTGEGGVVQAIVDAAGRGRGGLD